MMMKYCYLVALSFLVFSNFTLEAQSNPSGLFASYQTSRTNGTEPELPDFSYVGYHRSAQALPTSFSAPVFDVTQYGAVPNDGMSDKAAIKAAIEAANTNGSGVVFFPPGTFLVNESSDDLTEVINITSSNIVLKGSGSGTGGTLLLQNASTDPTNPNLAYSSPYLFNFKPSSTSKTQLTTVTGSATRESFSLEVADASGLSVGQRIVLTLEEANNPTLVAEEMAPFAIDPALTSISEEVHMYEIHQIAAINSNTLTFEEPIHRNVNPTYNWSIYSYNFIEEVGVQDLMYQGQVPLPFNHHAEHPGATALPWEYDSGWSGFKFNHVVNSWMTNVHFKDMSNCGIFHYSANSSALRNHYTSTETSGETAHSFISTAYSTGVLIGLNSDLSSGVHHACGIGGAAIGNVIWRNESPTNGNSGIEMHANQPRTNLIDACTGGFGFQFGGGTANLPNHLRHLVLWNFNGVGYTNSNFLFYDASNPWRRVISPIVSGLVGFTISSNSNQTQVNESPGTHVDETSLYEAQLNYRLGSLPQWVSDTKDGSMSVSPNSLTLLASQNSQLNTFFTENSQSVTWSSSNSAIVSVNSSGQITANAVGSAVITATASNGRTATANIEVSTLSVTATPENISLIAGQTQQISSSVSPSNVSVNAYTYQVADSSIASVDSNGLLTALAGGTTTVTVTAQTDEGNVQDTVNVSVTALADNYTETFDNAAALNNQWGPKSFIGVQNVEWTYGTGSKANIGAINTNNTGVLMNRTSEVSSAALTGGVSAISVDYKNRYNDELDTHIIKVYINDVLVGEESNSNSNIVNTLNITGLTIEGAFTIKIVNDSGEGDKNDNSVIGIDNIYWEPYQALEVSSIVYYNDFINETGSGFINQTVLNGGVATDNLGKRVSDIPDEGDTLPSTIFDRPSTIIPGTKTRDQRTISIKGVESNTNYNVEHWVVMTPFDFTTNNDRIPANRDLRKVEFWTQQRYANGNTSNLTVWASTDYTNDVSTANWTNLTNNIVGNIATSGSNNLKFVKGIIDLTDYANASNFTLAFKYTGSNATYSSNSRNGIFYISDVVFHATYSGALSNEQFEINDQASVYPNPSSGMVYVKLDTALGDVSSISLFNSTGTELMRNNESEIDLNRFPSGLYIIKIQTTSNQILYKKVIKN